MITADEDRTDPGKTRPAGIRLQERIQRVEKGLASLGNISGEFPEAVLEEARKVLQQRVDSAIARIQTKQQLTLYNQLEARAAAAIMTTGAGVADQCGRRPAVE